MTEIMANSFDVLAGVAVELALIVLAGTVLQRILGKLSFVPSRIKLLPFNRGVLLKGDSVVKVVEPGYHWVRPSQSLVPVDMRTKPFQVSARELLTADDGVIRAAFGGEYRVSDPQLYITQSSDAFGALYVALEKVIPSASVEFETDTILNTPSLFAERIVELIEPRAAQYGLRVTSLEVSNSISLGWVMKHVEPER
ncbi:SPFH domain-containing protein [Terriglobus roseus]|nr:SPFH domain-containing protein [Terriglobus roseus]